MLAVLLHLLPLRNGLPTSEQTRLEMLTPRSFLLSSATYALSSAGVTLEYPPLWVLVWSSKALAAVMVSSKSRRRCSGPAVS